MEPHIAIRDLTKHFGPIVAVDGVSFEVGRGEVLGFLGPNGAGKSTTMKMVTGFLPPTAGSAAVCGRDVVAEPLAAKRHMGYLPEGAPAYPDMTARAFLEFVAEVRGFSGAERRRRVDASVERVHLEGVLRQPIETLSKGFKRRVGLAQAILHDPPVLILDEPTDGLDPNQKHEVRELIRAMAADKVIVLSTHILEEVDAVCSRVIIINRGKVVADGTPAELHARSRLHDAVVLRLAPAAAARADQIAAELGALAGVAAVERDVDSERTGAGPGFLLVPEPGASLIAEVGRESQARDWQVEELRVEQGRLDEVFRTITTSDTEQVGSGGAAR